VASYISGVTIFVLKSQANMILSLRDVAI